MTEIKKIRIITAAAAAVFLAVTGVYGYFSDTLEVNNHISLGDVNIGLKEYEKRGTTETAYTNPRKIIPGDTVSKIPRITNYAEPCWIRARVEMENSQSGLEGFREEMLTGISSKWIKRGEYFYYTEILKKRESIDLFQGVKIPEYWTEEHSGQELEMTVRAEAVQAVNFKPDFSGMSPWGNQKIELCIHEKAGAPVCRAPETKLSVEFNGEAHRLLAVPGDFFINMGTAMPGDEFEDTVTVSNTTDQEAEIFFRTEVSEQNQESLEVLQGIQLSVRMDGKTLYQGTLDSPELKKNQSLGSFSPDEAGKLQFSLSIPEEWNNSYALREADVKWIFTVNEDEVPEGENSSGGGTALSRTGNTESFDPVKTGDETEIQGVFAVLFCSGAVLLIGFWYRKGGRQK